MISRSLRSSASPADWYTRTTNLLIVRRLTPSARCKNTRRAGKPHRRQSGSKFDLNHHSLMTSGLDLGLEKLTAGELADCFDELCSCGKEHSPENLRKLRDRMIKALERIKTGTKSVQEPPALQTN